MILFSACGKEDEVILDKIELQTNEEAFQNNPNVNFKTENPSEENAQNRFLSISFRRKCSEIYS